MTLRAWGPDGRHSLPCPAPQRGGDRWGTLEQSSRHSKQQQLDADGCARSLLTGGPQGPRTGRRSCPTGCCPLRVQLDALMAPWSGNTGVGACLSANPGRLRGSPNRERAVDAFSGDVAPVPCRLPSSTGRPPGSFSVHIYHANSSPRTWAVFSHGEVNISTTCLEKHKQAPGSTKCVRSALLRVCWNWRGSEEQRQADQRLPSRPPGSALTWDPPGWLGQGLKIPGGAGAVRVRGGHGGRDIPLPEDAIRL